MRDLVRCQGLENTPAAVQIRGLPGVFRVVGQKGDIRMWAEHTPFFSKLDTQESAVNAGPSGETGGLFRLKNQRSGYPAGIGFPVAYGLLLTTKIYIGKLLLCKIPSDAQFTHACSKML